MTNRERPQLVTWLLQRLASGPNRESLIGDLTEQYQRGRSVTWYWRQVLTAILVGAARDVRDHKLLAVRALSICWTAVFFLNSLMGTLRRSLNWWWTTPWKSEILRQLMIYYSPPFVIIACVGFAVTGWMIARLHRDQRAAMVTFCAISMLPWASWWGWEHLAPFECRLVAVLGFSFRAVISCGIHVHRLPDLLSARWPVSSRPRSPSTARRFLEHPATVTLIRTEPL
jgi:hypothetical protein